MKNRSTGFFTPGRSCGCVLPKKAMKRHSAFASLIISNSGGPSHPVRGKADISIITGPPIYDFKAFINKKPAL